MMAHVDTVAATQLVRDAYRFIEDVQVGRRDDFEAGYRECFAESFELLLPPDYPEGEQAFRGRAGLERWIGSIREIWDEWRMEQERLDLWPATESCAHPHHAPAGTSAASSSIARPRTSGRSRTAA